MTHSFPHRRSSDLARRELGNDVEAANEIDFDRAAEGAKRVRSIFLADRLDGGRDSGAIDEEARDPIGRPGGIEPGGTTLLIGDIDPREQPADHRGMRLRSAERRLGKEWVSTVSSGGSP